MSVVARAARKTGPAGAWCGAPGRLQRSIGNGLGGAGARALPASVAGIGRSLHRLALWCNGHLVERNPRAYSHGPLVSRRQALGPTTTRTARAYGTSCV